MSNRHKLPDRRVGLNFKFRWENHSLFLSTGYYEDGTLGEIFLSAGKLTSAMDVAAKDSAIAISLALQHGCPVKTLAACFLRKGNGDPEGLAGATLDMIIREGLDRIDPWGGTPEPVSPETPPQGSPGAAEALLEQPEVPLAAIRSMMTTDEAVKLIEERESISGDE